MYMCMYLCVYKYIDPVSLEKPNIIVILMSVKVSLIFGLCYK